MKFLLAITAFLFLVSCSQKADPYPWAQGQWISDPGVTMANNPQYDRLQPEEYARISETYGKVSWSVVGNIMEFYDPRSEFSNSVEFSVEVIDENSFNVVDRSGDSLKLWKSRTGFCTQTNSSLGLGSITECFRPFVAEPGGGNL